MIFKKDALESQDARKMGLRVCGATQRGFMSKILFIQKMWIFFSILIASPGFPGDPGDPGGARGPLKTPKNLKILKNLKNQKNPKKLQKILKNRGRRTGRSLLN